jgi:hypothetical protein
MTSCARKACRSENAITKAVCVLGQPDASDRFRKNKTARGEDRRAVCISQKKIGQARNAVSIASM